MTSKAFEENRCEICRKKFRKGDLLYIVTLVKQLKDSDNSDYSILNDCYLFCPSCLKRLLKSK